MIDKRIQYLILPIVINLTTVLLLNHQDKIQQTQNIKIQELQKIVFDLQLESSLLPKTPTSEQIEEIVTEIVSRVGGGSVDPLTPEQKVKVATEILSRIGGSTDLLTPEQTVKIVTEIIYRIGGF